MTHEILRQEGAQKAIIEVATGQYRLFHQVCYYATHLMKKAGRSMTIRLDAISLKTALNSSVQVGSRCRTTRVPSLRQTFFSSN